mgnify:CR=1 FL=1
MGLTIDKVLGEGGVFNQKLPQFKARPQQLALAEAIANCISKKDILIAEAGTGTGKTFAYLIPALLSGKKTIVSTGTKTLQDQLFTKDIPKILELLSIKPKVRLLKGRNNYLCLDRYHKASFLPLSRYPENKALFKTIQSWEHHTKSGEISELSEWLDDRRQLIPHITSTAENCLGTECSYHGDCFVYKARRRAQEADLLVINHHLLFADMAIKQGGFGELLPASDVMVLDESHQVPEIAGRFFSEAFTSRQITDLLSDLASEAGSVSGGFATISNQHEALKHATKDLMLSFTQVRDSKGAIAQLFDIAAIEDAFDLWLHQHTQLVMVVEPLVTTSPALQQLYTRLCALGDLLNDVMNQSDPDSVYWYDFRERYFALNKSPIDVAKPLSQIRSGMETAWVLTSATLTVNQKFGHYQHQTGFSPAETMALESPFDYQKQALMLLPQHLPEPNDPRYNNAMFGYVLPVIEAAKGGVFFLFTSHRALQMAAQFFQHKTQRPLFVQGQGNRNELLDKFRDAGNGLLLGAASFWEGVDVSGASLSCVIIDKLPFAHPNDPVLKAKIDHINQNGGNAFVEHQIPKAIIALKQGVGRLIRGETDRGVLVICDKRIKTKPYGKQFLKSLPPFKTSSDLTEAIKFFNRPDVDAS